MRYEITNAGDFAKAFRVRGGFKVVKPGKSATVDTVSPLDNDVVAALGKDGVTVKSVGAADDKPSLTGKNKAELLDIAKAEGVEVADDATNPQIVEAIEKKRAA